MNTRDMLLAAALKALEKKGGAQFSTRAVCSIAKVTAPTLYHHFGNSDGLLSAAIAKAFAEFLQDKRAAVLSSDPDTALRQGWDQYVRFAAARPRLYAAMMGRLLDGARIEAADQAYGLLTERIQAISVEGRLALPVEAAADLVWSSANAAALLHVTAKIRRAPPPKPFVIGLVREGTMQIILIDGPNAAPKRRLQ